MRVFHSLALALILFSCIIVSASADNNLVVDIHKSHVYNYSRTVIHEDSTTQTDSYLMRIEVPYLTPVALNFSIKWKDSTALCTWKVYDSVLKRWYDNSHKLKLNQKVEDSYTLKRPILNNYTIPYISNNSMQITCAIEVEDDLVSSEVMDEVDYFQVIVMYSLSPQQKELLDTLEPKLNEVTRQQNENLKTLARMQDILRRSKNLIDAGDEFEDIKAIKTRAQKILEDTHRYKGLFGNIDILAVDFDAYFEEVGEINLRTRVLEKRFGIFQEKLVNLQQEVALNETKSFCMNYDFCDIPDSDVSSIDVDDFCAIAANITQRAFIENQIRERISNMELSDTELTNDKIMQLNSLRSEIVVIANQYVLKIENPYYVLEQEFYDGKELTAVLNTATHTKTVLSEKVADIEGHIVKKKMNELKRLFSRKNIYRHVELESAKPSPQARVEISEGFRYFVTQYCPK